MTVATTGAQRPLSARSETTFPVMEVFGPTLQGEGPQQGRPAYFVRFGGCDFRCAWCDSMHAVDPASVRADARRLSADEIVRDVSALRDGPDLVVISGGNPALLDLAPLSAALEERGLSVAVETQGTRWRTWLGNVGQLVVSPKGPSSGMDDAPARAALAAFLGEAASAGVATSLKVVIFDDADLEYARWVARTHGGFELFLSVGTDQGLDDETTVAQMFDRLHWLSEAVAGDADFKHARVGAQQHVLTWGTKKGV